MLIISATLVKYDIYLILLCADAYDTFVSSISAPGDYLCLYS
jgi:hypothetical protein